MLAAASRLVVADGKLVPISDREFPEFNPQLTAGLRWAAHDCSILTRENSLPKRIRGTSHSMRFVALTDVGRPSCSLGCICAGASISTSWMTEKPDVIY
jgi:hypothetical protein